MTATFAPDLNSRVEAFLLWFKELDAKPQEDLMAVVYNEHKVHDVVRSFSSMPISQRKIVFQRLGLPNELLSQIPSPLTSDVGDIEVEWQEWDNTRSA